MSVTFDLFDHPLFHYKKITYENLREVAPTVLVIDSLDFALYLNENFFTSFQTNAYLSFLPFYYSLFPVYVLATSVCKSQQVTSEALMRYK